jgi:hypothetical protein
VERSDQRVVDALCAILSRVKRRILIFLLAGCAALGLLSGSAQAASRFVDPSGSDEANACLSAASPCGTIQAAIGAAEAGDTIEVAAGAYAEDIEVDKPLTIAGQGPATVIEGVVENRRRAVEMDADSRLEDLRIRGAESEGSAAGLAYIGGIATTASWKDVVAEQAPVEANGTFAVTVDVGSALRLEGSTIEGTVPDALRVNGSATVEDSTVSVNSLRQNASAISVSDTGTLRTIDSTVTATAAFATALSSEGGKITAIGSTFVGTIGVWPSAGSADLTRDRIEASETGLVVQEGAEVSLRDSLVAPAPGGELTTDVSISRSPSPATLTIVGSTLYAQGAGRFLSGARSIEQFSSEDVVHATIVDSILRAVEPGGGAAAIDIAAGSSASTWSVTHSDYTTIGGSDGVPAPGSGTNVAAVPVFAGQASGDYGLTSADGSLIDTGDPSVVLPGETDLAGLERALRSSCAGTRAPDIGAYELDPAEPCRVVVFLGEKAKEGASPPIKPRTIRPDRPKISDVSVKERRGGATLRLRLSEAATLTVAIAKVDSGRADDRRSATPTPVKTFSRRGRKGATEIVLAPRLRGAASGVYRLTITASARGRTSAKRQVSFDLPPLDQR